MQLSSNALTRFFLNKQTSCLLCSDLGTSFLMAVFQTTPWRLISGTLGLICLLLAATLGILFNLFTEPHNESTVSPGPNKELQEASDCCHCPEKWVGYRRNCYFISTEEKTWEESRKFCVSQNSSLLQLRNKDELAFMPSNEHFYWTGLSYNEERAAWFWEDGSPLSRDLFPLIKSPNPKKCIIYRATNRGMDESCEEENRYICKRQLICFLMQSGD
ncbi:natural killer cells antigen CD94-like [Nycticebus coucang]|uniref:natural killer cells antigen CD94-like n=1 Tax=Nycticebus coucang TaxID=9470 RepID=UPI00234DEB31|nr:natural killer cells antigen CD94-like [Nycticebus coucang]XP_053413873.1 natural killer cells antigen CD94-like [Nycticebus coucang]